MELKLEAKAAEEAKKTEPPKKKKLGKKNIELIIAAVLGLVAIIIYLTTFSSCSLTGSPSKDADRGDVEKRLAATLAQISGAGKVTVMITYADDGETVYAKDDERHSDTVTNGDKVTENVTDSSSVVIVGGKPLIEKELAPTIAGVLIVAEGGSDARVKVDLIRATQVALNVSANIIEVFPG